MKASRMKSNMFVSAITSVSILAAATLISGCQSQPFATKSEPAPRYIPKIVLGQAQTLFILPQPVACQSTLPMQCLQARTSENGDIFQIPYDGIEGFSARRGISYQISVRPQIDENIQQPTGRWTLQNILSQQYIFIDNKGN